MRCEEKFFFFETIRDVHVGSIFLFFVHVCKLERIVRDLDDQSTRSPRLIGVVFFTCVQEEVMKSEFCVTPMAVLKCIFSASTLGQKHILFVLVEICTCCLEMK